MDTSPLDLGRQATIRALQQATEDGSLQPAGSGTGKKKSSKVQLSSKPYGYGILLDGARTGAESNKLGAGVFIADILPKSDAARYQESLKIGRQIIAVNSVNVQNATVKEVRALFSANSNILIEVKGNKKLVGAYRKARQLKAENLKCTLVALENQPIGLLIGEAPNGADGVFVTGKLPGSAAAGSDGIQVGDKLVLLNGGSVE